MARRCSRPVEPVRFAATAIDVEVLPVRRGGRLATDFLQHALEGSPAADRLAVRMVDQGHRRAHAAKEDRVPHGLQRQPHTLPVRRQALVRWPEQALHAGGLAQHPAHLSDILGDIRTALPDVRLPSRRERAAVLVGGRLQFADALAGQRVQTAAQRRPVLLCGACGVSGEDVCRTRLLLCSRLVFNLDRCVGVRIR